MPAHCSYCSAPSMLLVADTDLCSRHWEMRCEHTDSFRALEDLLGFVREAAPDLSQQEALAVCNEWVFCHAAASRDIADDQEGRTHTEAAEDALVFVGAHRVPSVQDLPCRDEEDRRRAWAAMCRSTDDCACVVICDDCEGTGGFRTGLDTEKACHCDEGWSGTPREAIRSERRTRGIDKRRVVGRIRRDPDDQPCLDDDKPRKGRVAA